MSFRPKLSEVTEELRERATKIRLTGYVGFFALLLMLGAILAVDISSGWSQAVSGMDFATPRGTTTPLVIFIGIICDVIAIALVRMGNRLQTDANSDPAAMQIGRAASIIGTLGCFMIFLGPFIFGWLLLVAGPH